MNIAVLSQGLLSRIVGVVLTLSSPQASLLRVVDAFRVTWSKRSSRIRYQNAFTERAWKDAVQDGTRQVLTFLPCTCA